MALARRFTRRTCEHGQRDPVSIRALCPSIDPSLLQFLWLRSTVWSHSPRRCHEIFNHRAGLPLSLLIVRQSRTALYYSSFVLFRPRIRPHVSHPFPPAKMTIPSPPLAFSPHRTFPRSSCLPVLCHDPFPAFSPYAIEQCRAPFLLIFFLPLYPERADLVPLFSLAVLFAPLPSLPLSLPLPPILSTSSLSFPS